jgi:predicted metal-dependent enzyme (double-stranded beta helix superfamily)
MVHPLHTTAEDFVAGLLELKNGYITLDRVSDYVKAVPLSKEALAPYTWWSGERYTRNLIYRDDLFEVMTICWQPGQRTVAHTHNGQLGWMTVPQGSVSVENFRHVSCNAPERQNVVGLDCLGGATQISMERLTRDEFAGSDTVATVDKLQTIHRILNEDQTESAISLHIYSKPFDSCVAFDLENQRCFRRALSYYSKFGQKLA